MVAEPKALIFSQIRMGVCFQAEGGVKLAELSDRATVGSASSNPIVIEGKGVRALHGQFLFERGEFTFKDFQAGEAFKVGPWSIRMDYASKLYSEFQNEILNFFKASLKQSPQTNLSTAFEQVRQKWFCKEIPIAIQDILRTQFNEMSLSSPIEVLLKDPEITDILVEGHDCIWIEKSGDLTRSDFKFTNRETYEIYLENLLTHLHKTVDEVRPYLDFVFSDGSRGHLIVPPLTDGPKYLSIRKKRSSLMSLNELCLRGMFSKDIGNIIRKSLDSKLNILISGATGSGKTTFLKALMAETKSSDRLVVIEDTPELRIERENTAYLYSRADSTASLPEVKLRDLVRQSLRMRPDRIIIGEVRGDEALDLMHAMNTGHRGCMGSLHANSTRDALFRLQGLIQMSSSSLSEIATRDLIARNIHLLIHCEKSERGERRLRELSFVRGVDGDRILLEEHKL